MFLSDGFRGPATSNQQPAARHPGLRCPRPGIRTAPRKPWFQQSISLAWRPHFRSGLPCPPKVPPNPLMLHWKRYLARPCTRSRGAHWCWPASAAPATQTLGACCCDRCQARPVAPQPALQPGLQRPALQPAQSTHPPAGLLRAPICCCSSRRDAAGTAAAVGARGGTRRRCSSSLHPGWAACKGPNSSQPCVCRDACTVPYVPSPSSTENPFLAPSLPSVFHLSSSPSPSPSPSLTQSGSIILDICLWFWRFLDPTASSQLHLSRRPWEHARSRTRLRYPSFDRSSLAPQTSCRRLARNRRLAIPSDDSAYIAGKPRLRVPPRRPCRESALGPAFGINALGPCLVLHAKHISNRRCPLLTSRRQTTGRTTTALRLDSHRTDATQWRRLPPSPQTPRGTRCNASTASPEKTAASGIS